VADHWSRPKTGEHQRLLLLLLACYHPIACSWRQTVSHSSCFLPLSQFASLPGLVRETLLGSTAASCSRAFAVVAFAFACPVLCDQTDRKITNCSQQSCNHRVSINRRLQAPGFAYLSVCLPAYLPTSCQSLGISGGVAVGSLQTSRNQFAVIHKNTRRPLHHDAWRHPSSSVSYSIMAQTQLHQSRNSKS